MRPKEVRILNGAMIVVALLFALITLSLSSNESVASMFSSLLGGQRAADASNQITGDQPCSNTKPLNIPPATTDAQLTQLAAYQHACNSFVSNKMMIFTAFPDDTNSASYLSGKVTAQLKAFAGSGVSPIVIVEPYIGSSLMEYQDYMRGTYDRYLTAFFKDLRAAGVTDQMMGTWVPFPESNTPSWANKDTTPSDFATCVNKYFTTLRQTFPTVTGSVLLDAETYEPTDTGWNNGDYLDLVPYLQNINTSFVTSIGIEGFPWVSKATSAHREIFSASEFLQPDLAINAARELRTRDIWFNTGTFGVKYTNDTANRVTISPNERAAILSDILNVATYIRSYQQNEYRVSINLFSQDKSSSEEATDWSYLHDRQSTVVLKDFLRQASQLGFPVSIYDSVPTPAGT